ncbi:DNA polymerase (mitochondrion) [Armillaria borealis]|uniref:DNA polymerase n=1 Tax=Armillaria borealis TaxID=47425 RepID=A0A4D6FEY6_9AGAR|nr:DNA polymerase [Armillaria borealis]QCB16410.1 DNA polymerase [Armillaria borealis]
MSKLLLISNIGKFGQEDITSKVEIVSKERGEQIMDNYQFEDVFFINDDLMMIKYNPKLSNKLLSIIKEEEKDISIKEGFASKKGTLSNIAIAAFISAYGRVHLNKFRIITAIVYTGADCIFTENPIDPKYIGPEIEQLKLKSNIIKGFFIKPKFYSYLTDKGKEVVVTAEVKP